MVEGHGRREGRRGDVGEVAVREAAARRVPLVLVVAVHVGARARRCQGRRRRGVPRAREAGLARVCAWICWSGWTDGAPKHAACGMAACGMRRGGAAYPSWWKPTSGVMRTPRSAMHLPTRMSPAHRVKLRWQPSIRPASFCSRRRCQRPQRERRRGQSVGWMVEASRACGWLWVWAWVGMLGSMAARLQQPTRDAVARAARRVRDLHLHQRGGTPPVRRQRVEGWGYHHPEGHRRRSAPPSTPCRRAASSRGRCRSRRRAGSCRASASG